jgi:hypothetical protein
VPYINGKRVSNDEWSKYHGSNLQLLHTGPTGVNPASAPEVDEAGAPAQKKAKRSPRSQQSGQRKMTEMIYAELCFESIYGFAAWDRHDSCIIDKHIEAIMF